MLNVELPKFEVLIHKGGKGSEAEDNGKNSLISGVVFLCPHGTGGGRELTRCRKYDEIIISSITFYYIRASSHVLIQARVLSKHCCSRAGSIYYFLIWHVM